MNKIAKTYLQVMLIYIFFCSIAIIVISGTKNYSATNFNANTNKSVEAKHLFKLSMIGITPKKEKLIIYDTFSDAISNIDKSDETGFVGWLTAYGPDCPGCGSGVACPPGQNVTNGNIYFDDSEYGSVRILAADRRVPCGTIMRVKINGEEIIGIVMDRGGAIKDNHLDLLFESESVGNKHGTRYNVEFNILRWGW